MNKNYIYAGLALVAVAFFLAFFVLNKDKSVDYYTQKFCSCGTELSELENQRASGRLSPAHYQSAKKEFETCLGSDQLNFQQAADSIQFYDTFVRELRTQCPETARNLGFKISE